MLNDKRKHWWRATAAAAALALTAACGSGGSGSESKNETKNFELVFAGYQPEDGSAQADSVKYWLEEVTKRTNGKVTFKSSWGGSLLPAGEIYAGVKDGRVDVGWESTIYYSSFPLSTVVNIPFVTSNQQAVHETFDELYESHAPLKKEWHANGLEMLAMFPSDANTTAAPKPITSLSDYRGKDLRAVGETPTALKALKANPVSINVTELYESIERGVVDGYMNIPLSPGVSLGLFEVAPHVTHDGVGIYGSAQLAISKSKFDSLPADVQKVMQDVALELAAADAKNVIKRDDQACDAWLKSGGKAYELSAEDVEEWKTMIGDAPMQNWLKNAKKRNDGADEFYTTYQDVLKPKLEGAEEALSGVQRCARR